MEPDLSRSTTSGPLPNGSLPTSGDDHDEPRAGDHGERGVTRDLEGPETGRVARTGRGSWLLVDETGDPVAAESPRGWSRFVSDEMMIGLGSPVETSSARGVGWRSFGGGDAVGATRTSTSAAGATGATGTARTTAATQRDGSRSSGPEAGTRRAPRVGPTTLIDSGPTESVERSA